MFLFSLLAIGLTSYKAVGQSGAVTAQTTNSRLVAEDTKTGEFPFRLRNQPQLEKHIQRIMHFRALLEAGEGHQSSSPSGLWTVNHSHTNPDPVIPKSRLPLGTDAKDLAILELEMSISARDGPSTFYPGAGLVMAIQQIGNLSKKHMIEALRDGGKPIYSSIGHLIGVEDPASGRLLGGRRS